MSTEQQGTEESKRALLKVIMQVGEALFLIAVLIVMMVFFARSGSETRRQSVECVRAGGHWSQFSDRCTSK